MTNEGDVLWEPSPEWGSRARITGFAQRVGAGKAYDDIYRWSMEDLDRFWRELAEWAGVRWSNPPEVALADASMPGAKWFPGATVNYAEHALYPPCGVDAEEAAVIFRREDGLERTISWSELRSDVAAVRSYLQRAGVGRGDRVAGLVPNAPEALIAMLAAVSLGALWSSCSPDFGVRAAADRLAQIEPGVLFAVDGYRYGGRPFDISDHVAELRAALPSLTATVLVPYLDPAATLAGADLWSDVVAPPADPADQEPLGFEPVPFDAPMWILYSSGTTGLPKPIVHGQGGILLEHMKQLSLHLDLGPGDRFFWFTTTGWMMWNLLVSGLLVGATVVLYDGHPMHPGPEALWQLAEDQGITCFGVSAPYIQSCQQAGIVPSSLGLGALRSVGSTGAPLSPAGFAWVYEAVKKDVMLSSLSGGTDVCTAFVGGVPILPVRAGIIPCRLLACAVEGFDAAGRPVVGQMGELVITAPMPSMPVGFWGDADGSRLREAYFDTFPGVWHHGDWIKIDEDGSCVIYGRSDATLNRGGVRMGTAEFYRVVEEIPGVEDSLVIDTSGGKAEGRLLLFIVPSGGAGAGHEAGAGPEADSDADSDSDSAFDGLRERVRSTIRRELSPRHVPDQISVIDEVPRTLNGKKCEVPVEAGAGRSGGGAGGQRGGVEKPGRHGPVRGRGGRWRGVRSSGGLSGRRHTPVWQARPMVTSEAPADLGATPLPADRVGLLEGMATTRAIRRYTDEPVPPEALRAMLFAATRAPRGSNRQPFRFMVLVDGPNAQRAKQLIGGSARRVWAGKREHDGYDAGSGARTDSPKARMARTMEHFVDHFEDVPVLILPCLVRYRDPNPMEGASVYPAVQNLLLAARGLGYGGAFTGMHATVEPELRQLLKVPDGVFLAGTVTIGRPAGHHGPVRRRPLPELVYGEEWDAAPDWAVDPPGTGHTLGRSGRNGRPRLPRRNPKGVL